ncbi:MAG TPA: DNA-binding response regulator [Lachnospiraceae bacterium]|jgi:DNA-binding response OmpR family regulator|nr:response regulator transcription factor [Lachnospiraceae bacterium]MDD6148459.1 response regulator transcription factor [Lachnospiraceae bacterium]MDY5705147.1 response regulator transcription factor [Lachnospiraceae bacterium]MEE3357095.1 response regulator transcription factor [Lachnospiraceae bacterium]HAN50431.1 DNA-binding response regulator [Lachnospiraceae bacterium]
MNERVYRILIAEDDGDIVEVLKLYLENQGYEVLAAPNGRIAYEIIQKEEVDMGIFDIMMPEMNGYELTREVRKTKNIPIIILSAKQEDSDKIIGLDIGADDYLTKPFNPLEVVARVKAQFRRYYQLNPEQVKVSDEELVSGDLRIDMQSLTLYKKDEVVNATPTELKILILLMRHPGRIYTKVQIYEHLNGEYFENDENALMVHISNLRNRIEDDPKHPEYLLTVRGLGYKFRGDK